MDGRKARTRRKPTRPRETMGRRQAGWDAPLLANARRYRLALAAGMR
ncbi:hypothetical protein J31TS4_36910 [Paenibacillus sp. J31TS4]|nr:hypothetical protein [Paenibacillus sp. J31TS4]GIP40411.1 hypothetical protein J31TS4_36910 [Paenibacillus sp. J31TS4]